MQKLTITLLSSLTILVFTLSNCKKEIDTIATVQVLNSSSDPAAGYFVRVFCPNATCNEPGTTLDFNINRTGTTNSSGKVTFNYTEAFQLGQAGFAVLDIEVYSTQDDMDKYINQLTTGVIKIEEETDNEQVIICQSC